MTTTAPATTNRIDAMFADKKTRGERASVFYVTVGFPNLETTELVIDALVDAGTDLIELGIPFSDPIADGPTIQQASQVALQAGVTVREIFSLAERARRRHAVPLILFSAFNPVFRYGLEDFVRRAVEVGVDGLLIPDLPPEEAEELEVLCRSHNLRMIFLVAPTTSPARREKIVSHCTGFIYYIALRGVTGARERLPEDLRENILSLKSVTDLPVVAGFGISRPDHAAIVGEVADGIVVGSALINVVEKFAGTESLSSEVSDFARSLIAALPNRAYFEKVRGDNNPWPRDLKTS